MNVLHIENPAGVASSLRDAQRKIGVNSDVLVTWPNRMAFPVDREVDYKGISLSTLIKMKEVVKFASDYDVLHVHSGINWKRADLIWLGAIKSKPILLHYHGSETRMRYGSYFSFLGDAKVVSTPDLLDWWKDAKYVPNPADDELFTFPHAEPSERVRILHMPTDRRLKGTNEVLEAISLLDDEGMDFEFVLLENALHTNAISAIKSSDIVIDSISEKKMTGIAGMYGKTSIEAMALGKVAVAYIDPVMRERYPEDLAVVSPLEPRSAALADCLRSLLSNKQLLSSIMVKGRNYASREHSQKQIVQKFDRIYKDIL